MTEVWMHNSVIKEYSAIRNKLLGLNYLRGFLLQLLQVRKQKVQVLTTFNIRTDRLHLPVEIFIQQP